MKHPVLKVEKRTVLGKKIKQLRRSGILPANIYGKDVPSLAIQMPLKEFQQIFKEVGETGLVDVTVDGASRPALIKNIQMNYLTHTPLHADFYQVNLKEKVKTMVPLIIVGEAKAVLDKVGLLLQTLSEVEVEALPESLPENIEVNVEHLAALDDHITVGNMKKPAGVEILSDPSQTVAKIAELVVEEKVEEPVVEIPVEGAEGEATPAETPAEGTPETPGEK